MVNNNNSSVNNKLPTNYCTVGSSQTREYRDANITGLDDRSYHDDVLYMDNGLPMLRPTLHSLLLIDHQSLSIIVTNPYVMKPENCLSLPSSSSLQQQQQSSNNNISREKLTDIISYALSL